MLKKDDEVKVEVKLSHYVLVEAHNEEEAMEIAKSSELNEGAHSKNVSAVKVRRITFDQNIYN